MRGNRPGIVSDCRPLSWVRPQATDVTPERSLDTQLHRSLISLACFHFDMLLMDVVIPVAASLPVDAISKSA